MPLPGSPPVPPTRRSPGTVVLLAGVAAGLCIGAAWGTSIPLGVPGEWEWSRVQSDEPLLWRLALPLAAALLYAGFVLLGLQHLALGSRPRSLPWVSGLVLAGVGWLWIVQQGAPTGYDLTKSGWVLYYPKSSGYFTEARRHHGDFARFLAQYEQTVLQGDVLHQGTHPPGLILTFELLLRLVERFPELQGILLATEPENVSASFREIQSLSQRTDGGRKSGQPLKPADRAVLWLAFLLVQLAAASTVLPLFGLLRRTVSPAAAWLAAAFWPTVPALALFIPKSDALFPLVTCSVLLVWLWGVDSRGLRAALWGLVAGGLLWLGLLLSLAPLVIGVWGASATLAHLVAENGPAKSGGRRRWLPAWSTWRPLTPLLAGLLVGLTLPTFAFWFTTGCNLPAVWLGNYHNHAGFYAQYPRTWWKWLLANPVELAVAAGVPLAVTAVAGVVQQVRSGRWSIATVSFVITWGLLWLSGKNMGEAARLWLFLMPGLCWIAGEWFDTREGVPASSPRLPPTLRAGTVLFLLQLAVSLAIVTRIGGFQY